MRIRVLSDLHLETSPDIANLSAGSEDVVVLAGDISTGVRGIEWAKQAFTGAPVVYVLGNHECRGGSINDRIDEAQRSAAGSNVHVLENQSTVIQGVRFLGCTLWTDFQALGESRADEAMELAQEQLSDFQKISAGSRGQYRPLLAFDLRQRHLASSAWLRKAADDSKEPVVVVTHFGPLIESTAPRYREDLISAAFVSDASKLMRPPVRLWISGHTHFNVDLIQNGVRVVSNQRGYGASEGQKFDWNKLIELTDLE